MSFEKLPSSWIVPHTNVEFRHATHITLCLKSKVKSHPHTWHPYNWQNMNPSPFVSSPCFAFTSSGVCQLIFELSSMLLCLYM